MCSDFPKFWTQIVFVILGYYVKNIFLWTGNSIEKLLKSQKNLCKMSCFYKKFSAKIFENDNRFWSWSSVSNLWANTIYFTKYDGFHWNFITNRVQPSKQHFPGVSGSLQKWSENPCDSKFQKILLGGASLSKKVFPKTFFLKNFETHGFGGILKLQLQFLA